MPPPRTRSAPCTIRQSPSTRAFTPLAMRPSAVAANLGLGLLAQAACEAASNYIHEALRRGYRPGRSEVLVLDHFGAAAPA